MHIFSIVLALLVLWAIPWKIYAVWLACKRDQKKWFVVLLFLNTVGILELVYIFKVAKKSWAEVKADFKETWSSLKRKK